MLRTVFVTGSLPDGGAERHSIALLKSLAQRGHDCHAVCVKATRTSAAELALPAAATLCGLDARRYLDPAAVAGFAKQLARLRPQAIIAANPYALMYASLARAVANCRARLIVTFHTTKLLSLRERLQMLAYRPLFWNADCTVFLSHRQRRYWRRRGLVSRRVEVIHNGVDTGVFREQSPLGPAEHLRRSLGYSATDYVIGMPALLRVEKNHLQLVEAVARLRRLGIPARALMIGDGAQRCAIEARARELGIAGHVAITGLQRDVRPCIASCDTITLCSVTETFSLAALEAMAMGKPLVLSDIGGAAEMIAPGWNGLLFPTGDTEAYVNCLARLSDPESARRMGRNARRAVEQYFSAESMVDRYEGLLDALCAGDGAAPSTTAPADDQRTAPRGAA